MADHQARLLDVLGRFDQCSEGFPYYDVSGALRELVTSIRESGGEISQEMTAETIAFELVADYRDETTGWGTYYGPSMVFQGREYPGLACITPDVVTYWVGRTRLAGHPLLRARYADTAWDLWKKVGASPCPPDVPRIMIDATAEAVDRGLAQNDVEAIRQLERALTVAIGLRDVARAEKVRDAILAFEDRVGVDHFPGLWGFSFDLLIEGGRKVPLADDQASRIISGLEARLARLAGEQDATKLEPHHVEGAALRLARYYRKRQQDADVKRVLGAYAGAYVRKAEGAAALVAAAWLQRVHETLIGFNLKAEAEAALLGYRAVAQKAREEMHPITASVTLDRADVDTFLDGMTGGDWQEVFSRLVVSYLPQRDEERQRLDEAMKGSILGLFSQTLVGHDGRALAGIGSMETDPEGRLIRHTSQTMAYVSWSVRAVVERLVARRQMDVEHVTAFLYQSPVIDSAKRPIVEAGLRAYLAGDWLVAVHLLVPQIEDTVRRLVGMTGGQTMKKGRNDGLLLRNLDELLRDERAERVLGVDGTFYLRVLLTEQRGWNLRNDVAHGITPLEQFNAMTADRLFHSLLLLGSLRAEPADAAGSPDAEPEGIEPPTRLQGCNAGGGEELT